MLHTMLAQITIKGLSKFCVMETHGQHCSLLSPPIEAHGILWTVAVVSVHYTNRKYRGDGSEPAWWRPPRDGQELCQKEDKAENGRKRRSIVVRAILQNSVPLS